MCTKVKTSTPEMRQHPLVYFQVFPKYSVDRLCCDGYSLEHHNITCAVFPQLNAAATIIFISQSTAATIQGRLLYFSSACTRFDEKILHQHASRIHYVMYVCIPYYMGGKNAILSRQSSPHSTHNVNSRPQ